MKAYSFVRSILFSSLFAFTILFTLSFAFAVPAHAQTIEAPSVQTTQILPPGGNSCVQLPVSDFTPYVYDGALHAFQFDVPDSSYVAIAGTVGEQAVPFDRFLRMTDGSGNLRMHADVPTTPIEGNLVVSVTMLSVKGPAQPVCMSILLSAVAMQDGTSQVTATPVAPTTPTEPATPSAPETADEEGTSASAMDDEEDTMMETEEQEEGSATSTSAVTTMAGSIADYCLKGGAMRLWVILLVVYALIVIGTILGQSKLPKALQSQEWTATAIVVPFLVLFGFWYFAESCRTSAWIPVAATVIALAGLSAAFWERKDKGGSGNSSSGGQKGSSSAPNVINLPGSKK